ncbi:hypothetical protein PQO03_12710 [Lentisphaera profundi]|uniref:Uncharacterized protein n=1 Tax=Lentisphaera profundi TaxID=1658616 RepID=A0ABY7W343_9BACT|nr:hypothetical protein [Lentisphaera profundi]WDE98698.1 hypothetical protein PQO03_12710 [Lentisphaera profundi]
MILQDQQIQNFYAPHIILWKLKTKELQGFADELNKTSLEQVIIGFDRYTWSDISSGQMPSQLMPTYCADFITILSSQSDAMKTFEKYAEISSCTPLSEASIKDLSSAEASNTSEPDFDNSAYLIIEGDEIHCTTQPYEFEGNIEGCFFIPSKELSCDLHNRVRDKEKIDIETGPKIRC